MRRFVILTTLALAGCHANPAAVPTRPVTAQSVQRPTAPQAQRKPAQLLVKFKGRPALSALTTFRTTYGTRNVGMIESLDVYVEELTGDKPLQSVLKAMNADPLVDYAEPNGDVTVAN